MAKKFFYFAFLGILFLLIVVVSSVTSLSDPDKVIRRLHKAIDLSEEKGVYNCCIEPACTMCYLGHWKFEKGSCHCDAAIAEGRFEDVCPECRVEDDNGICGG